MSTDKLIPPAKTGTVSLPNGCTLYWNDTEQGREYISDEIGGGVQVWHTALVDVSTLLAAMTKEAELTMLEAVIKERKVMPLRIKARNQVRDKDGRFVDTKKTDEDELLFANIAEEAY